MRNQRMLAASRAMSFASQFFRISVFIFFEQQQLAQAVFEIIGLQIPFDAAPVAKGNLARLLADDDGDGIALLGDPEPGPVAQAQVAVEVVPLADREDARRRKDAVVAKDQATVVERGFGVEDGDEQLGGSLSIVTPLSAHA